MKTILTILLLGLTLTVFGQNKLQEQFGFWRVHSVTEFTQDTVINEAGKTEIVYKAKVTIYREGIDGNYDYVIPKNLSGNVNGTIEYMATKPEYVNYIIVE